MEDSIHLREEVLAGHNQNQDHSRKQYKNKFFKIFLLLLKDSLI